MSHKQGLRGCFGSIQFFGFNIYHSRSFHFGYQKRNRLIFYVFHEGSLMDFDGFWSMFFGSQKS